MNVMERKNTELINEFNAYIRERPEFTDSIPKNALILMQLEGDEEFNRWSLDLAEAHRKENRPVVYVRIKKMRPIRSRIEELELQQ